MTRVWSWPRRIVGAVADATLGTAIVLVHTALAQRQREQVVRVREAQGRPLALADDARARRYWAE